MNVMMVIATVMMTAAVDDSHLINLSVCSKDTGAEFADTMMRSTHFKFHFLSNHHSQTHPMEDQWVNYN